MSLSGLIPRPKTADLSQTIVRLEEEHQAALLNVQAADQRWQEAVAGDGDPDEADRLFGATERARRQVEKSASALAAARNRQATNQAEAANRTTAEKWAKLAALSETRSRQAAKVAGTISTFSDEYAAIQATTAEMRGLLGELMPGNVDDQGAMLMPAMVEQAIREEMVRGGVLTWAFPHPWGIVSMRDIQESIRGTVDAVSYWRANAQAGK